MNARGIRTGLAVVICGALMGAMTGCATTAPSRELVDARQAFNRAKAGPAGQVAMADVYTAQRALQRAEDAHADDPKADASRDLAYVAHRKALYAEAQGNIGAAQRQKAQAMTDAQKLEQQRLSSTTQQLNMTQAQLDQQKQALEKEQQARAEAEAHARQAIEKMAGMAAVKQEPRGLVITLSGSVLFASGKSELLGSAQGKLGELVKALKEDSKRSITVVGHTDAQGDDNYNLQLSQRRADAVRQYLVSQGIESDRVKSVGMGEAQPIADNANPEGRANNRRVEVVLENEKSARLDTDQTEQSEPGARPVR